MPCADSSDHAAHACVAEAHASLAARVPLSSILASVAWRAVGGGLAGAAGIGAAVALVTPLRTVTTVQLARGGGGGTLATARALWASGGMRRLYAGAGVAAAQAMLARFGNTAANVCAMAALSSFEAGRALHAPAQAAVSALAGALFRIAATPLDALRVAAQADGGAAGVARLREAVRVRGVRALFDGAAAAAANGLFTTYFYFAAFHALRASFPAQDRGLIFTAARDAGLAESAAIHTECVLRNTAILFGSNVTADVAANSMRVVKTVRMTTGLAYYACLTSVLRKDGLAGLLGRGLTARLSANGLAAFFNGVAWLFVGDVVERQNHNKGRDLPANLSAPISRAAEQDSKRTLPQRFASEK